MILLSLWWGVGLGEGGGGREGGEVSLLRVGKTAPMEEDLVFLLLLSGRRPTVFFWYPLLILFLSLPLHKKKYYSEKQVGPMGAAEALVKQCY